MAIEPNIFLAQTRRDNGKCNGKLYNEPKHKSTQKTTVAFVFTHERNGF